MLYVDERAGPYASVTGLALREDPPLYRSPRPV